MKYKELVNNKEINAYLKKGDENLGQLGFTDHSKAHCMQVAHQAGNILERFGYPEHDIELAKIAGLMHDIGKIRIPDEIIKKEEDVDDVELDIPEE